MAIILFDAYGTLLDVTSVRTACAEVASDPAAFVAGWRLRQLEYSWLRTLMGRYLDFEMLTGDALDATAAAGEIELTAEQRQRLLLSWRKLAPYPEVPGALRRFHDEAPQTRMGILSNGTTAMLDDVVVDAGLAEALTWVLSVDAVQTYKPAPAVYQLGCDATGSTPDQVLFVSSNDWDVSGAASFGFRTCWVNRAGAPFARLGQQPNYVVRSLDEIPIADV